ncbi:MAG: cupin domain-containing protein [Rhodospirillales bacterium]
MPDDHAIDDIDESRRMRERYGVPEGAPGETMGVYGPVCRAGKPKFFNLRTRLLEDGRSIEPLAETENLWTWLKVYASGGENTLHAHTKEDHMFIVLNGRGKFYGPNGEVKELGRNEGLMLPAGSFYNFHCSSEEPLVLLRVGSRAEEGPIKDRIGIDGDPLRGGTKENKFKPPVYSDTYYE